VKSKKIGEFFSSVLMYWY